MDRKDIIIERQLRDILELRERVEILDPDFYKQLVEKDRKYLKILGRDIRMRNNRRHILKEELASLNV